MALFFASLIAAPAFAYYNRGSVDVSLGTTEVGVRVGETASTTVSITPSSDEQTEGCGMPKCPQGCAASCADENGQCRCAGAEYKTHYPAAVVSSSNASVVSATYSGGTLTVYGKGEGEADVTVRVSLRQFNDAEAILHVKVEGSSGRGEASPQTPSEMPEAAQAGQDDRLDIIEKTVMGRPVHNVRIGEATDVFGRLSLMAGTDGDVVFWEGDTYYHPAYSLTFLGTDYDASAVSDFDVRLGVTSRAEGALNQLLSGLDEFLVVDFAQRGALLAPATVYAFAEGALSDDSQVALYSWDAQAKEFVREDAEAAIVGGYAKFTVEEGKTYVVSSRDLTIEANEVVAGGEEASESDGSSEVRTIAQGIFAPVVIIVAIALAAAGAVLFATGHRREGDGGDGNI